MKIASLAVAASLMVGGLLTSQSFAQGSGPTGGAPVGTKIGQGKKEKHPEIMKAMRNLEQAKKNLQAADRDFGGHRTKAVDAVNLALDECKAALAYDKH